MLVYPKGHNNEVDLSDIKSTPVAEVGVSRNQGCNDREDKKPADYILLSSHRQTKPVSGFCRWRPFECAPDGCKIDQSSKSLDWSICKKAMV